MYLSSYRFSGDPDALAAAYDRLQTAFPAGTWGLRACIRDAEGILVLDACPTREVAEAFGESADFSAALASVGLPRPRIERLGEVHDLLVGPGLITPAPVS